MSACRRHVRGSAAVSGSTSSNPQRTGCRGVGQVPFLPLAIGRDLPLAIASAVGPAGRPSCRRSFPAWHSRLRRSPTSSLSLSGASQPDHHTGNPTSCRWHTNSMVSSSGLAARATQFWPLARSATSSPAVPRSHSSLTTWSRSIRSSHAASASTVGPSHLSAAPAWSAPATTCRSFRPSRGVGTWKLRRSANAGTTHTAPSTHRHAHRLGTTRDNAERGRLDRPALPQHRDAARRAFRHRSRDRFVLLAISAGGEFACAAAWRLPQRVSGLGLFSVIGPLDDRGSMVGMSWRVRSVYLLARFAPFLVRPLARLMVRTAQNDPSQSLRAGGSDAPA